MSVEDWEKLKARIDGAMRICVDLDRTLTQGKYDHPHYDKCLVNENMAQWIRDRKEEGHLIYIWTARYSEDRQVTARWLKGNSIPFDGLFMNKILADVYIDDKALRFENVDQLEWEWEEKYGT